MIARLCEPVIVMAEGRHLAEGPFAEVAADPRVQEAYMGRAPVGLLSVEGVVAGYCAADEILKGVDLELDAGEIVSVIGPERRRQVHAAQGHRRHARAEPRAIVRLRRRGHPGPRAARHQRARRRLRAAGAATSSPP